MRDLLAAYLLLGLGFKVSLFHCLLQVFTGNDDSDTVVYNALSPPVTTMFVRVLPIAWNSRISMRIELYGCPGNLSKLRRSGCYKFAISTLSHISCRQGGHVCIPKQSNGGHFVFHAGLLRAELFCKPFFQ